MIPELTLSRLAGFKRGETLRFSSSPLTLGTGVSSQVAFDPTWDRSVSGTHAILEWRGDGWWIRDQSKDGVWSKGRKFSAEEKIVPGSEIELGRGGPRLKLDYNPAAVPFAATAGPTRSGAPAIGETRTTPVMARASEENRPPPPLAPLPAYTPAKPASGFPVGLAIAIAAVIVIGAGVGFYLWSQKPASAVAQTATQSAGQAAAQPAATASASADEGLAAAAKAAEQSIGLVVVIVPSKDGSARPVPFATSWAIGPKSFATNSHVTEGAKEYMKKGLSVYVIINRNPDRRYKVTRVTSHPKYGKDERNFDGRAVAVGGYDVGLIEIEDTVSSWLKVASRDELEKIDSGYRIAYLGFPMENLSGGGVDPRSPVATMQSGITTSATDWWLSKAPFEKRLLIQHNLGATGGASGSPIFNARGEVVGVLNAGNIALQLMQSAEGKYEVTRTPSAAMVNFAQRVDLLKDIYSDYGR